MAVVAMWWWYVTGSGYMNKRKEIPFQKCFHHYFLMQAESVLLSTNQRQTFKNIKLPPLGHKNSFPSYPYKKIFCFSHQRAKVGNLPEHNSPEGIHPNPLLLSLSGNTTLLHTVLFSGQAAKSVTSYLLFLYLETLEWPIC